MLHCDGAIPDSAAGTDATDADLDDAVAELACDREVKQCSVPERRVLVVPKSNGPDLRRFEDASLPEHGPQSKSAVHEKLDLTMGAPT